MDKSNVFSSFWLEKYQISISFDANTSTRLTEFFKSIMHKLEKVMIPLYITIDLDQNLVPYR